MLEKLNITLGIILVDSPFIHWERIQQSKGKNVFVCMYDEIDLYTVNHYIDADIYTARLMHGGSYGKLEVGEKKYDVVMCSSISELTDDEKIYEEFPEGIFRTILEQLIKRASSDFSRSLDLIMYEILDELKIPEKTFLEDKDSQEFLSYVYIMADKHIRNKMRHKVLEQLLNLGIQVNHFGNCNTDKFNKYSNFINHGSIDYLQLQDEIAKAKILVNDVKAFVNGSHERVLSAMLNNTLVFSNKNSYCNQEYRHKENMIFYDLNHIEDLGDEINYYLEHEDERKVLETAAYELTSKKHTWKQRADELEEIYLMFKKNRLEENVQKDKNLFEKISVIVPCYNVEHLVSRCIDSLVTQSIGVENLEIILVNDASTDHTLDVLLDYEKQYPDSIMVINLEKNMKQGGARNVGIQYASAEYIGFVDSDDWVERDMYEKLYYKAKKYNCDYAMCRYIRDDGNDEIPSKKVGEDLYIEIDSPEKRKEIMRNVDLSGGVWSRLYKKDFILKNNMSFPENISYEDNYWGAQERLYVEKIYVVNEILYHYYFNHNSTITQIDSANHFQRLTIELMKIEFYKEKGVFDLYQEDIETNFLKLFYANTLHIFFTRMTQLPIDIIKFMQRTVIQLFPEYKKNKIITQGPLFDTIDKEYSEVEWARVRREYLEFVDRVLDSKN